MREAVTWNPSMSTGVPAMDAEHRRLLDVINELDGAMRQGAAKEVLDEVFGRLEAYAGTHFSHEEQLMLRSGFPEVKAHMQEHRDLVAKARELQQEFHAGRLGVAVKVLDFLGEWLVHHIQGSDQEYGPWLTRPQGGRGEG